MGDVGKKCVLCLVGDPGSIERFSQCIFSVFALGDVTQHGDEGRLLAIMRPADTHFGHGHCPIATQHIDFGRLAVRHGKTKKLPLKRIRFTLEQLRECRVAKSHIAIRINHHDAI